MADSEFSSDKRKGHRPRQSGVKAEKKKLKDRPQEENLTARQRNPKAFAINSAIRAERNFRRKEDITAKRQHIPLVDQTPEEPPPILIAIVGPPKVGKSTLIRNLIKNFTRTNVVEIKGPITIVTSKKRRITLIECNNDINSMIDIAKCADLILLLCDASYGFEMEIFEFLNICQVHGMPKIMGVLTHLDMIKNPKALKKRKKELKHRFWTEVYDGAKLFYLSGIIHGEYLRNEITNLGRFISIIKFRPLTWRSAHSYVLVDRVEDVTNTELIRQNSKCDRDIILYGYVRGIPMNQEFMVHIAGLGDARLTELNSINDPCPMPGTEKKRNLLEKERLLYAPMSGVGGIVYDKDAMYIELQGSHSHKEKTAENQEQDELLEKLIDKKQTVDVQIEEQEFRLFSDGDAIKSKDFKENIIVKESDNKDDSDSENDSESENDSDMDDDEIKDSDVDDDEIKDWKIDMVQSEDDEAEKNPSDEEANNSSDEEYQDQDGYLNQSGSDESEDDEPDEVIVNNLSWKDNLAQKARDAFLERQSDERSLMKMVYGVYNESSSKNKNKDESSSGTESEEELGGLFKVSAKKQNELAKDRELRDKDECCFFEYHSGSIRNWLDEDSKELIRNLFVTGKWKTSDDAEELLQFDDMSDVSDVYGDFEDLETGLKHSGKDDPNDETEKAATTNETQNGSTSNETEENSNKRKLTRVEEGNLTKSEILAKKMKLKAKFDSEYDKKGNEEDDGRITGDHQYYEELKSEALKQSQLNKNEFAQLDESLRLQIEGYRSGLYVRMGFNNISSEFIDNFDPCCPILVGGLNMAEENIGYVNCKVKKHRWYKKILKTGDPLIISMGWRRFQTIPIYAKVEDDFKQRYLKYTPNHVTCSMTFYGPITPQNTGFLALQSVAHNLEEIKRLGFRIAATGSVTELDATSNIMKKLKLVGAPFKIYKKSAFIKGMFNTSLEIAKFEGAKIRTVSGIRGQIKKAHNSPEGSFRATFEDKILLSDIVFCRTWFRVDIPKFYAPITTLLLPIEQKTQWQGMKTLGQLKRELNIKNEAALDSLYTDIKREPKIFRKLVIPKALQRALPYKDKPKHGPIDPKKRIEDERVAVIRSPQEQKIAKMLKMVEANYADKKNKEKRDMRNRARQHKVEKKFEVLRKEKHDKAIKKKVSRAISKMRSKPKS